MDFHDPDKNLNTASAGNEMYKLIERLFPICRSITGDGVRDTLRLVSEYIPVTVKEVPTGTTVFDWTVPKEWNIRDAWVKDSSGRKIIDFADSNLHVLGYSKSIHQQVSVDELKKHLFTLPEHPDWIPYRTSYYNETWGFCITQKQFNDLRDETYEVMIDSSLTDGHLTYGELFIKGKTEDEVLISCHICHPSLCNDNLSGVALSVFLARHLSSLDLQYSYRFLFIPGTIGSIVWLCQNEENVHRIKHGLVVACVGDSGSFHYKKSRQGSAEVDRVVVNTLKHSGFGYRVIEFFPFGYDERQYCSPGINLPVGCLMRTPHGEYPEYHTSADNLSFIKPKDLEDSLSLYISVMVGLEKNATYINQYPKCEPQLGKRGLYQAIGGSYDSKSRQMAMLWVLNLSDGNNSLLDISERSNIGFALIQDTADILADHKLIIKKNSP